MEFAAKATDKWPAWMRKEAGLDTKIEYNVRHDYRIPLLDAAIITEEEAEFLTQRDAWLITIGEDPRSA